MKDLMKQFATNERGTTYFRDYAINQIRVAYRLKDYLDPDICIPPKDLNKQTMKLFLDGDIAQAVYNIINDELIIDISSSYGSEEFQHEAFVLATEMVDKFKTKCEDEKIKERNKLMERIKELDKEIGL
jgi:superfamily II DNA or RNA helicase